MINTTAAPEKGQELSIDDLIAAKIIIDEAKVARPPQMQVRINDLACEQKKFMQFRFPKSKKKRVRKKWSKQNKNWRMKVTQHFVHDQINNIVYVSSKTFEQLKKTDIKIKL